MPLTTPHESDGNTTVRLIKSHRREPRMSRNIALIVVGNTLLFLAGVGAFGASLVI